MAQQGLGLIEDTLFVPMLGRIYASEYFPAILYDEKALELKAQLPKSVLEQDTQTQYTYLASASRSANMDRRIRDFLARNPDGILIQLGIGLETTYNRNDNGHTRWYGVDLPHVLAYRRSLLPETPRETYLAGDAFDGAWLQEVRRKHPGAPLLVTASGLFYYFPEENVLSLIRLLRDQGNCELVFDAVSKGGLTMMNLKYMKTIGHKEVSMYFYVDSAEGLAKKAGAGVSVLADEGFYQHIPRAGLSFVTKMSMTIADWLGMVKIIQLQLGQNAFGPKCSARLG